jgi:hypothetical protein
MPTMYRCPGELRHTTRGFLYDQREFADAQQARADGWAETLEEAAGLVPMPTPAPEPRSMPTPAPSPVTRAELEAEAEALGIGFNARTSDEKLIERIAARG